MEAPAAFAMMLPFFARRSLRGSLSDYFYVGIRHSLNAGKDPEKLLQNKIDDGQLSLFVI